MHDPILDVNDLCNGANLTRTHNNESAGCDHRRVWGAIKKCPGQATFVNGVEINTQVDTWNGAHKPSLPRTLVRFPVMIRVLDDPRREGYQNREELIEVAREGHGHVGCPECRNDLKACCFQLDNFEHCQQGKPFQLIGSQILHLSIIPA